MNRIHSELFTATIFRNGKKVTSITIFLGGMFGTKKGICISDNDSGHTNSYNGEYQITEGNGELKFSAIFESRGKTLTRELLAEEIWSRLMRPIQS